HLAGRVVDPGVLEALDAQPEFRLPIWDYLAGLVDAERIADGRRLAAEHAELLQRVEAAYGVEAATVVAVWGVESDFGRITGKRELLSSLATLSCHGRRQAFFRGELFSLLALVQRGDVDATKLTGSWAGAFGQTQFMPSTYQRLAQDFDGDGRRDLVGSVPDALASTANFLKRAGWRKGEPWGVEVRLPDGFKASLAGRTARRPLDFWRQQGVGRAHGEVRRDLPGTAALLMPAGREGPAWLVFRNFDAIYGYNAAESYALAISLLSDAIAGRAPMQARWPTDDPGTSRAERRELQALLLARGHAIGEVDGLIGALSREAIKAEEARLGWTPTGRAGQRLLQALRDASPQD
ncbi:MAG: lytic murein transglycosylase, partial [Silanimonas sp.]